MEEPEFCAEVEVVAGPEAARDRMAGLVAVQAVDWVPPSILLMALEEDQEEPVAAGPRQIRQLPMRMFEVRAGSRSQGASMSEASLEVWVGPMVGVPVKSAVVQAE